MNPDDNTKLLAVREDNPFTSIGFMYYLHSKGFEVQNIISPRGLCHMANLNKWIFIHEIYKYVSVGSGDEPEEHISEHLSKYNDLTIFKNINELYKYLKDKELI